MGVATQVEGCPDAENAGFPEPFVIPETNR